MMKLFKKKPTIKIIAVTHETRDYVVSERSTGSYSICYSEYHSETTKRSYTIVLCNVDGELVSREFNGKWTLNDIKKWEDL